MPSILIGRSINGPEGERYVISDFLGRGSFGEVYRANGESSGSVVAVKLLSLGHLSSDIEKRALLNEIKAAEQISHPNVVRVLYVHDDAGDTLGPYVCMEYVSGGTLARLLSIQNQANAQIPLARALDMMIDIAQGCRAINDKLIHRDIKPDNILIENKALKIGDFGISKFANDRTRPYTFKGGQHVAYMAPEGWVNEQNTFKLDVYAVGLVFSQILTLKHPLAALVKDPTNTAHWERVHLYEVFPDLRRERTDLPISLTQLISRMVAKRPQDRPNWDETLRILSDPAIEPDPQTYPAIAEAVAAAVAKRQEQEKQSLESARKAKDAETQRLLYSRSCKALIQDLGPIAEQFNSQFQFGKIETRDEHGRTFFRLPTLNTIEVSFFEPRQTTIRISGGVVVGGGWIGLVGGRSANLVLLRDSPDDLYGRWVLCEVRFMALVGDRRKLIGRFGLTEQTVEPFGFKDAFFYDQMQYAQGGLHVFTYAVRGDVTSYFADLIKEGCS